MPRLSRPHSFPAVSLWWIFVIPLILIGCSGDSSDTSLSDNPVAPSQDAAVTSDGDDDSDSSDSDSSDSDSSDHGGPTLPPVPEVDPVVGAIGLYADEAGSSCNILENQPSAVRFAYVIHTGTGCKTASAFSAPMPDCMVGAIYLNDLSPFPVVLGNSQTGVSVAYGSRLEGPVNVLTIVYFGQALSESCCPWAIQPEPRFGDVRYATCDDPIDEAPLPGLYAVVNPTRRCPCPSPTPAPSERRKIQGLFGTN